MSKKIIILDFNGATVTGRYIYKVNKEQEKGARIILWTCREKEGMMDALKECHVLGIFPDAINEDCPNFSDQECQERKIFDKIHWFKDNSIVIDEEKIDVLGNLSDGYHTFNDLYNQRMILSAALFNAYKDVSWKSRKHNDGKRCFNGEYFIVGIDTVEGQYTYHYKNEFWDLFDIQEIEKAPPFDGHTSEDVERLLNIKPKDEHSERYLWALREIELARKFEKNDDILTEYIDLCYDSAFEAYKSLLKDYHSGMSIWVTQGILNSLIDNIPLTPIEDTDDIWNEVERSKKDYICYQNKRMSSLFKYVYNDGRIKYKDISRFVGVDINDNCTYHSEMIDDMFDKMWPITMPYSPSDIRIKVFTEDILTDRKNGDFDTRAILYVINDGEHIDINRYFKEFGHDWIEITKEEYDNRKKLNLRK